MKLKLFLLCASIFVVSRFAKVYKSIPETFKEIFPHGFDRKTYYLSKEQQSRIEQTLKKRGIDANISRLFIVYKDSQKLALIETAKVRTKPATILMVFSQKGILLSLEILRFDEPPEYKPPQKWLDYFIGFPEKTNPVDAITGATLSSRMVKITLLKTFLILKELNLIKHDSLDSH
ncbi:MAG: FMN-binding protein [Candidatus Hydrogenedentota bacterium]|nr:MAG: FMN-binding protein [Candidatus Hydrogenedentota bacterium]